ncbi:tachykinins [Schistocerca americana]|uniref:tachykinins n=1 Tax=Schistocerca americana TaxID=7009 RepID=UPI001F4FA504|nr:tachykinins [Schistocerca americana]
MCRVGALLLLAALVACEGAAGQGPDAGEQRAPADAAAFLRMRAAGGDGDGKDALLEKRAPLLGFHGVRGKKDDLDELDKRAPSLGFHGVRGKKDDADDDDGFDKRAPMRGFQGVRGKKDEADAEDAELGDGADYLQLAGLPYREDYDANADGDADADELQLDDPWLRDEKRALKGFFGTRGKKAPQAGFYGVRGKKGPSGFYGVRGKKAPLSGFYGVRGKKAPSLGFHGVRGKKDDGASPPDLDSLLYYLNEASEATRQKRGNTKKAPVGFYGTRGKKSWAPDGGAASSSDSIASSLINSQ